MILSKIETSSKSGNSFLELQDDFAWSFVDQQGKFSGDDAKIKLVFGHRPPSQERGRNSNAPDCKIDFYINLKTWHHFYLQLANGKIADKTMSLKKLFYTNGDFVDAASGSKIENSVYSFDLGGSVSENRVLSRKAYLTPATKRETDMQNGLYDPKKESTYPAICFVCEQGPGEKSPSGIIIPKFTYKPKNFESIMIPMTLKELDGFCRSVDLQIQCELTRLAISGAMKASNYQKGQND